jgi:hypothetical protein
MLPIKLFSTAPFFGISDDFIKVIRWDATTTMIASKNAKLRLLLPLLSKITDKSMPFFVIIWKMATLEMATKGYLQANVCLLASRQRTMLFT